MLSAPSTHSALTANRAKVWVRGLALSLTFAFGLLSSQGEACWKRSEYELQEFLGALGRRDHVWGNGGEKQSCRNNLLVYGGTLWLGMLISIVTDHTKVLESRNISAF